MKITKKIKQQASYTFDTTKDFDKGKWTRKIKFPKKGTIIAGKSKFFVTDENLNIIKRHTFPESIKKLKIIAVFLLNGLFCAVTEKSPTLIYFYTFKRNTWYISESLGTYPYNKLFISEDSNPYMKL